MFAIIFLIVTLVLPWFTLFFTTAKTVKTYMPVTIFTCLLMTIIFQLAYTYHWWIIHKQIVPWGYITDVSFAYGIFALGTFWIFKLTSHRFLLYVVTNVILDAIMAFLTLPLLNILGIAEYVTIRKWQYFLVMFGLSFIIYGYHKWQSKLFISNQD